MNDEKNEIEKYEIELKKLNKELNEKINNLVYLLCNVNIKDINLINYHYTIKDILNKIDYIENILFNLKY